ncbi:SGNH/GDSL hydrolase family protein [Streptomyces sp. 2A115]|uniref:SGNH/GDSL hydrolase family protein n=1 Tax=Streptomyces sp. 2A115 TaxID=3457439 RepID=UPI003FD6315F
MSSATAGTLSSAAAGSAHYVALGDSYASGAGVPTQKDAECARSTQSYPSYLATMNEMPSFKDVTCSGATTRSMWNAQGSKPPQVNALSADTRVVTLSIGGNDIGFTSVLTDCVLVASSDPAGSPCKKKYTAGGSDQLSDRINTLSTRIGSVLSDIKRRSPQARVMVVGYPSLMPDNAVGCKAVPIAAGDFGYLRDTTKRLNSMLSQQATRAGAAYVDTYKPTVGHDMCETKEVRYIEPLTSASGALPGHPNWMGQYTVALSVYDQLR